MDHNFHKPTTSNKNLLTDAIAGLISSEGLSYNIFQKYRLKKLLKMARNISNTHNRSNRKHIYTELLYVLHE